MDSVVTSLKNAPPVDVEIVIVNNASTDNTVEVINAWSTFSDFPVTLITESRQGIGPARNCGLRSASGEFFICIDDDCRLDKDHISRALAYFKSDEEPVMRYGSVHLGDPADWPMTIHTSPDKKQWQIGRKECGYPSMGNMIGCNFTMPREIFERVGFYDETFGSSTIPGGEDADYGFRVFWAGFRMEFAPDMMVRHYHGRRSEEAVWKLIKGYQISAGALYAKYMFRHPHIRSYFLLKRNTTVFKEEKNTDERTVVIHKYHKKAKIYYLVGMLRYYRSVIKKAIGF